MLRRGSIAGVCVLCACGTSEQAPAPSGWQPGVVHQNESAAPRGLVDVRGIIHAHSVYSHDACDGLPRGESELGPIDQGCFEDFRDGLCKSQHDFVMLSDHGTSFAETDFPEVLLHRPERGDELVERDGDPVASWAACDDGKRSLVLAGTETGTMPVGLERHLGDDAEARHAAYSAVTPEAVAAFAGAGAVTLLQHTEDWTPEQIEALGVDGFEMFNLHANAITGAGGVAALLSKSAEPELLPHPELSLLPIVNEDARYLETWATVLANDGRYVTTMGSDCHRNTFPQLLQDGERIDSYRRVMGWFSNHLRVAEADWDDRALKDALRAGRVYGTFDVLGYPQGFDFFARAGGGEHEMGAEVALGAELVVHAPSVADLDPSAEPPLVTLRLLRAREGEWEEVGASSDAELVLTPAEAGAYRAEVRIVPRHLRAHLSSFVAYADRDFVWVYANAIYLVE